MTKRRRAALAKEAADNTVRLDLAISHAREELEDAWECNDDERVERLNAAIKRYQAELAL